MAGSFVVLVLLNFAWFWPIWTNGLLTQRRVARPDLVLPLGLSRSPRWDQRLAALPQLDRSSTRPTHIRPKAMASAEGGNHEGWNSTGRRAGSSVLRRRPEPAQRTGRSVGAGRIDQGRPAPTYVEPAQRRPSIVLIVLDDASLNVVATMRNVRAMARRSAVYRNGFVADSYRCPSRAAMFTGLPPHLNGVLTNSWRAWAGPRRLAGVQEERHLARSYNVPLRQAGYRTGFVGKYLNEYNLRVRDGRRVPPPPVPGWNDSQALLPAAYAGWGFFRTLGPGDRPRMRLVPKPARSAPRRVKHRSYAQTVITRRALHLIGEYRQAAEPYFLQVSTYAPHARLSPAWPNEPMYPAAFADRPSKARPGGNCGLRSCFSLGFRDLVGYRDPPGEPARQAARGRRHPGQPGVASATHHVRCARARAPSGARADGAVGRPDDGRIAMRSDGTPYVILTSDNGYHVGQHSLNPGKGTPYDTDTRVPLMVTGPAVEAGPRRQLISNIDLAATLETLAGREPSGFRVGRSFAPSLARPKARGSRFVFIHHTQNLASRDDPDAEPWQVDRIPSYQAVRSRRGLLVWLDLDTSWRGKHYVWELYRYDRPWEDRNVFRSDRRKRWARALMRHLRAGTGARSTSAGRPQLVRSSTRPTDQSPKRRRET